MAATEIFQLLGKIGLDGVEETNRDIDSVNNKAGKLGNVFDKAGKIALGVGKAVAVGIGAASVAIGGLIKASVDGYAEYEQLVGGVDTLFGESSERVQEYAAMAYRTAGMTANEYMSTVTSFSASLLQSLEGDTIAAANYADMAIRDMSDNANKMGTDIASIQNAYQGFAKGNFTMLDNLKLGYGGTKEEMERLLRRAEEIGGYVEGAFSIDSYADIVEAINLVQTEMGITGTTAKEAMETIQGSTAATKSAWQNLIVGFAAGNQDLDTLVSEFVDSAVVMIGNIAERIQIILPRLVEGLQVLISEALPHVLTLLSTLIPELVVGAANLLIQSFPILLETVKTLFGEIWNYIAENLFGVEGNFEETFAKVSEIFNNVWGALQETWNAIGQPIWDLIQACLGSVHDVFGQKMPEIQKFVSTCFEDISYFWQNNLKPCFDAIGNFIQNVLAPTFERVFNRFIGPAVDTAFAFIADLWNNTLKPVFTGITDFLTGVFTGNWKQAFEGIVGIVRGIMDGLVSVVKFPINQVINLLNSFISGLNRLQVPDWVPLVGGKGINIPLIPQLEEGGILEKGQVGFLEGNGAEAVVPLDQNEKWINKVAMDMNAAVGGGNNEKLQEIIELLKSLIEMFPETMIDAFKSMKFDVNNREFARLVKAVN